MRKNPQKLAQSESSESSEDIGSRRSCSTIYKPTVASVRLQALIGLIDQAIISIGGLAIGIALIRFSSKEEYAMYVLAYGLVLLAAALGTTPIISPMISTAHEKPTAATRNEYCRSMLNALAQVTVLTTATAIAIIVLINHLTPLPQNIYHIAIVVLLATPGFIGQEFIRRYYYLEFQPINALLIDIFALCLTIMILIAIIIVDLPNKHIWAIASQGASTLSAATIGFRYSQLRGIRHLRDCEPLRQSWPQGRWALTGMVITWIQNQSYAYFMTAFGTLSSLAEANAARLMFAPLLLLNTAMNTALLPRLAKLRATNHNIDAERFAALQMLGLICIVSSYTVAILLYRNEILPLLFTDKYADISDFVLAWGFVCIFMVIRSNTTILLQAHSKFQTLALANAYSCLWVLASTSIFLYLFDAIGAVYALASGELLLGYLLFRARPKI